MKMKRPHVRPLYGCTEIVLPIENEYRSEAINWVHGLDYDPNGDYVIELKKKRKSRSMSANRYFWTLVHQLAVKLGLTDDEVYRELVRDYGVSEMLAIPDEQKKVFARGWGRDSTGWFVEDMGAGLLRIYYGTSVYNTQEMSRIIDGLVRECKTQGIETMTDDELRALMATIKEEE